MSRGFDLRRSGLQRAGLMAPLAMLLPLAAQAFAAERLTVAQLEHAVAEIHGLADDNAAQRLMAMELTQRLTRARYEHLKAEFAGEKSRMALRAMKDAAGFLELPGSDTLHDAAPDAATQGQIVSRAADFVVATVAKMPDFFASRTTTRFQNFRLTDSVGGTVVVAIPGFNFKDRSTEVVTYRNGREEVEAPAIKKPESSMKDSIDSIGLVSWGIFGKLLGVVMTDVMRGKIGWSHWEQGPTGPLAVFRFVVPRETSSYTVHYCCFLSDAGDVREFEAVPAYHGEMAIDPANGAIYRLVVKTELEPLTVDAVESVPIERLDLLVEYGPVEIGGKTYICPIESTSISRAEALAVHGYVFYVDKKDKAERNAGMGTKGSVDRPKVTAINDVVFENYHRFRAEMRILPGDGAEAPK